MANQAKAVCGNLCLFMVLSLHLGCLISFQVLDSSLLGLNVVFICWNFGKWFLCSEAELILVVKPASLFIYNILRLIY